MAKKKTKSTKVVAVVPDVVPNQMIHVQAQVGMDEVVAIKLSEYENQLLCHEQVVTGEIVAAQKTYASQQADASSTAKKAIEAEWEPHIKKLEEALAPFGDHKVHMALTIRPNSNNEEEITICFSHSTPKGYGAQMGCINAPMPAEAAEKFKTVALTQAKIGALNTTLAHIRNTLAKMSFAERQLKGKVARMRLQQTAEGQGILSEMDTFGLGDLVPSAKGLLPS